MIVYVFIEMTFNDSTHLLTKRVDEQNLYPSLCGGCDGTIGRSWKWDFKVQTWKNGQRLEQILPFWRVHFQVILPAIWTWRKIYPRNFGPNKINFSSALVGDSWATCLSHWKSELQLLEDCHSFATRSGTLDIEVEMDPHFMMKWFQLLMEKGSTWINEISSGHGQMTARMILVHIFCDIFHDMLFMSRGQSSPVFIPALRGETCWTTSACQGICCILGLGQRSWRIQLHLASPKVPPSTTLRCMPRSSQGRILPNQISTTKSRLQAPNESTKYWYMLYPMCKTLVKHMMRSWKPLPP